MTTFLAALALSNVVAVWLPMVAAIPYVRQTALLLEAAHALQRRSRAITGFTAGFALALALWSGVSWTGGALVALMLAGVWLSRRNLFEWIFPAAVRVQTAPAHEFRDVEDNDMVIGVI